MKGNNGWASLRKHARFHRLENKPYARVSATLNGPETLYVDVKHGDRYTCLVLQDGRLASIGEGTTQHNAYMDADENLIKN